MRTTLPRRAKPALRLRLWWKKPWSEPEERPGSIALRRLPEFALAAGLVWLALAAILYVTVTELRVNGMMRGAVSAERRIPYVHEIGE